MSQHLEQVAAELTRAVQTVLSRGIADPRVKGLISITRVEVSPDFAHATVYVSVLPEEHAELTLHGLKHATPHFRHAVSQRVRLRRMPRLAFKLDRTIKREAAVLDAIRIARERDRRDFGDDMPPSEAARETES